MGFDFAYNRVSSLTQGGSIIKKLNFQYDADKQRNKSLYYENNVLKKTFYSGDYLTGACEFGMGVFDTPHLSLVTKKTTSVHFRSSLPQFSRQKYYKLPLILLQHAPSKQVHFFSREKGQG